MKGPYLLESKTIDNKIKQGEIGNYHLGSYKNEIFNVLYIGRSDICLNSSLKDHIDEDGFESCTHFKYIIQTSVTDAYKKECQDFHTYHGTKGNLNINHPAQPSGFGKRIPCPVSDCEESK
ncbi:TPA: hypothetical protein PC537_000401 [Morganella morganii]|nr:hypothetical protein [Morganella morganii]